MSLIKKKKFFNKVIFLRRRGTKHHPLFEVILKLYNRNSKNYYIEKLGFYNPNFSNRLFFIDVNRLSFWLNNGVFINFTVKKLILKLLVK